MPSKHDFKIIADIDNPLDGGGGASNKSSLFENPEKIICANSPEEIPPALEELAREENSGKFLAGYISYEAACFIENSDRATWNFRKEYPLILFGVFQSEKILEKNNLETPEQNYYISRLKPAIEVSSYIMGFEKIKKYILDGITYQINFTFPSEFIFYGNPLALYAQLKKNQQSSYNFYLKYNNVDFISVSPELFFCRQGNRLLAKPMKGTLEKSDSADENLRKISELYKCEKNRAENAMITDVFRNDFGKICQTGSIAVDRFFEVEEYPTLYQTTSTVSGKLKPDQGIDGILKALLPSASVTGAPKTEAVERIHEIEGVPRGIYTGSFGVVRPNGDAVFNVSIRTLEIINNRGRAGFGSGIVFDSDQEAEYNEVLLKSKFIYPGQKPFFLFETILVRNHQPVLLRYHLERLQKSATYFQIPFDYQKTSEYLFSQISSSGTPVCRLKLILREDGSIDSEEASFPGKKKLYKLAVSSVKTSSDNEFASHKTSLRYLYDGQLKKAVANGCDEVLFFNEHNELAECAVHNIMVKINGLWYTPPVSAGILPGTFRRYLLEKKIIYERKISDDDLRACNGLAVMNSLRGINRAEIVFIEKNHSGREKYFTV